MATKDAEYYAEQIGLFGGFDAAARGGELIVYGEGTVIVAGRPRRRIRSRTRDEGAADRLYRTLVREAKEAGAASVGL